MEEGLQDLTLRLAPRDNREVDRYLETVHSHEEDLGTRQAASNIPQQDIDIPRHQDPGLPQEVDDKSREVAPLEEDTSIPTHHSVDRMGERTQEDVPPWQHLGVHLEAEMLHLLHLRMGDQGCPWLT